MFALASCQELTDSQFVFYTSTGVETSVEDVDTRVFDGAREVSLRINQGLIVLRGAAPVDVFFVLNRGKVSLDLEILNK